mmetsp:Transcript_92989/g.259936  ORF Transcript_92989/g.259936 Transcript_92989/m.259936 type:complete len:466 (+) Transcript_92989:118-1515(+)
MMSIGEVVGEEQMCSRKRARQAVAGDFAAEFNKEFPAVVNADASVERPRKWRVRCGERAVGIKNPIREIMDTIAGKENPSKRMISLAQGDPTAYPHLRPGENMVSAVAGAVASGTANGYQPSQGNAMCRAAVAEFSSIPGRTPLKPSDIFMTLGCSEALSHCVAALATKGSNLLLPRPGFCLYQVLCEYHGVEARYYDLLPDHGWEVDLGHLRTMVDDRTCAILVNNPSNPCGAVYSKAHMIDIMRTAESLCLPVIADEVYAEMAFDDAFVSCAAATTKVPVLSVCALSKRWLAPGWRLGWVALHDADGIFASAKVSETLLKLCQVSLGPSAPLQAALPDILKTTSASWYAGVLRALKESADCCVRRCSSIVGLEVASEPQGAMYFMVRLQEGALQGIGTDDVAFARQVLQEESVAVLPGQCFNAPGFFRVVFAAPPEVLEEAFDRIEAFCRRRAAAKQPRPESP